MGIKVYMKTLENIDCISSQITVLLYLSFSYVFCNFGSFISTAAKQSAEAAEESGCS